MFIRSAGFAGTILLAAGLAQAAVIHVSLQGDDSAAGDSWATAKRTIQAAVDVAGYADTVLISNGIHVLTNTIRIEHDVGELRSLDGRNVIIDGNHQVPCLAANKRVNLHGLTFRNGKGTGPTETGGGISMTDGGLIADCQVISNRADGGGGICGYNLVISNCVVAHNLAIYGQGGGLNLGTFKDCGLAVLNTVISNNTAEDSLNGHAEGGGIRISEDGGQAWIINCRIVNNRAVGPRNYNAGGGLYVNYATALTVRNTLIAGNEARDNGGGAWVALGTAFENCTIAGNVSDGKGSGLLLRTQSYSPYGCRVENSIVFSNYSLYSGSWRDDVYLVENTSNWFDHVVVGNRSNDPPLPGTAIVYGADPRFLNGALEAWRLSRYSPCINAGTNRPWMIGARDLDRVARLLNGIVDLGCYETDPAGVSMACFMTAPPDNQVFGAPAAIPFQAMGYALKPTMVTQMVVYADTAPIATGRDDDLGGVWTNVWGGRHTLQCRVWDGKGNSAASAAVTVTVLGPSCRPPAVNDFDGDRRSDLALYGNGAWSVVYMKGGGFEGVFGDASCRPVAGDFNGDGYADRAVYQDSSGAWGLTLSGAPVPVIALFGLPGVLPVPGDFNGDGQADLAVYHPASGSWYYRPSGEPDVAYRHGWLGGAAWSPAAGDFDGDGRADFGVYQAESASWYVQLSASGQIGGLSLGGPGCVPVPGYYDYDYQADPAVYDPHAGLWTARLSGYGYQPFFVALAPGGLPVRGDFDGDRRSDLLTYTEAIGTWQGYLTARGWVHGQFGGPGWIPVR